MYPTNDGRDSPAGFFSHHGFWALGVRLFRHLGFRAKAGIVTLCFMLPMAVLGAAWLGGHLDQRDFTGKEIRGLVFAREAMALLPLAVKQREAALQPAGAAADGGDAAWQAAMKRVEEAQAASGDDFGTAAALNLVKERRGALALAKGSRPTHDAMVKSVIDLVTQITDGSNLTLDPDIDTYYLMDGSLMRVPPYIDEVARLRLLANAEDAATAQHRAQAYADLLDEQLQGAIAKVDGLHPGARQVLMGQAAKAQDTDSLMGIQTRMFAQLDELLAARQARNDQRATVIVIVVALGLLCAGYFFASFYRVMDGGLKETRRHLLAMTDGDLTTHPRPWGKDEAAQLMIALGQMQTSLRTIVRDVRQGSDQILQASGEIAHGAIDLSQRTEETAANLQQTAATMEQISGTARHTAESASTAASIARENAGAANQGGQAMGNVVRTMEAIGQSSSRIGEIIGVIDGIAFQTNILALNAAVEAARAGDAGRGFAVVAAEVRGLAQRSGDAAREIKSLIQTSMGQVADGNHVVAGARQAIDAVVANADRVGGLIDQIAAGAQQQSASLHEVGQAAHELDRSTQGNAALVEQTAAAAASLRERAADLASRVAAFRLPDSTEIG